MRFTYIFVSACLVGILVGCSQPASSPSVSNPAPSSTGPVSANEKPATPSPSGTEPSNTKPAPTTPPLPPGTAGNAPTSPSQSKSSPSKTPATPSGKTPNIAQADLQWHPSTVSVKDIAKQTDDMIRSLKNVQLDVQYSMNMAIGRGSGHLQDKIKDSKTFMLQYPSIVNDKKYGPVIGLTQARGDGQTITELTGASMKTHPVGTRATAPQNLAAAWPLIGNREVFAGLIDGRGPFEEYMAALSDPKSKYKTAVMERNFPYQGRTYRQYQIISVETGQAQISGGSSVSMIIDANIHLPVTINVSTIRPGESRPNTLVWEGKWQNNVKFEPKDFHPLVAPKPEKKPAPTIKT